ncbi:MAG: glycosyltransferase family 2 protein [Candidatus Hodarchaeota archaeon]
MTIAKDPLISIIVPVYNEEESVRQLLSKLLSIVYNDLQNKMGWSTEILIVDDGSTDKSFEIIREFTTGKSIVRSVRHKKNRGKGSAISTALKHLKGSICIIQDADLEYDPSEITKLLRPIIKGEAHVVYGSRFLKLYNYKGMWANLFGNKALSVAGSFFVRRWITDMMTCYKAFHRKLLDNLKAKSFDVEPEITVKLLSNRNIDFTEIPINYNPRIKGKKIKKIHGFISLWRLVTTIIAVQRENRSKK